MPFHTPKYITQRMKLRPNPDSVFHQILANRWVLHIDVFAYWNETNPDQILLAYEYRKGGRDAPIAIEYFLSHIGSSVAPSPIGDWILRDYDITDAIRFNTRSGRKYHDWANRMHHEYFRTIAFKRNVRGCKARSVLFHYWHVYEMDPTKGFNNFYIPSGNER